MLQSYNKSLHVVFATQQVIKLCSETEPSYNNEYNNNNSNKCKKNDLVIPSSHQPD